MKPNIFNIATKELSQDGFITWLLLYADSSCKEVNPELNQCAQEFVNSLIKTQIENFNEEISNVEAGRQWEQIDVWAKVNGEYLIIIEDKTNTGTHDNQLQRYKLFAENWCKKNNFECPICVYLKTGNESSATGNIVKKFGYSTYYRKDFVELMRKYSFVKNDIFSDFLDRLNTLEFLNDQFKSKLIGNWGSDDWQGFYQNLEEEIHIDNWYFVNNIAGGFWNALITTSNWNGSGIYFQIEQGKLCFKIEPPKSVNNVDVINLSLIRNQFCHFVINKAKELGLNEIKKPKRFGTGTVMTSAVIEKDLWLGKDDEIVSIDKAVESLNKYIDFFEKL